MGWPEAPLGSAAAVSAPCSGSVAPASQFQGQRSPHCHLAYHRNIAVQSKTLMLFSRYVFWQGPSCRKPQSLGLGTGLQASWPLPFWPLPTLSNTFSGIDPGKSLHLPL